MRKEFNSESLRKRLLLFLVVYLIVSFSAIVFVVMYPLLHHMKGAAEQTLIGAITSRQLAVQEHLAQMEQIAQQIAYKTGVRSMQEDLAKNRLSLQKFKEQIRPRLRNAITISANIAGIAKLDTEQKRLVSVGILPPEGYPLPEAIPPGKVLVQGPFTIDGNEYLQLSVPLFMSDSTPMGRDIFLFTTSSLKEILKKKNSTELPTIYFVVQTDGNPYKIILCGDRMEVCAKGSLLESIAKKIQNGEEGIVSCGHNSGSKESCVASFAPIFELPWLIVGRTDESLLYREPYRQFGPFLLISVIIVACGVMGMLLLFRPVAGKVFVYSSDLEKLNKALREEVVEHRCIRERLQKALTQKEKARKRISAILSSVPDPLFLFDSNRRILLLNSGGRSLLGIGDENVKGHTITELIKDREKAEKFEGLFEKSDDGNPKELIWNSSSGERQQIYQSLIGSLDDTTSSDGGTILLLKDVTRQKELDRMKSEFISTAAHELRTPMTTIIGFSELLLVSEEFTPEEKREFLTYILGKTEDLSHIVDDLLDITRIESGRGLTFNKEPLLIDDLIKGGIEPYRRRHPDYRFDMNLNDAPVIIVADRVKVIEVLDNLLSNAVKYSSPGDTIIVTGKKEGPLYHLEVTDHGIGMTTEVKDRIFEKFFRADASNTARGGIGLGMFIVKHVIEGHGGEIWVESAQNEGTTIHFTLPVAV